MRTRKRRTAIGAALLTLALVAMGCGSNGDDEPDTPDDSGSDADDDAGDYPSETVEVIVSFSAGGGMDVTARTFVGPFSEHLGTSVVVANVEGGGGVVGLSEGVNAEPDGYTLTHVPPQIVQHQHFRDEPVPYSESTWETIGMVSNEAHLITVSPTGAAADFETGAELIQYAIDNPGELTMGVGGILSSQDVSRAIVENETGAAFNKVYYDGGAPVVAALLSGDVDFGFLFYPEVEGQVAAGELEVIGSLGSVPPATLPDLPTLTDEGIDVVTGVWRGFVAPAGTPAGVMSILRDAFQATVTDQAWLDAMDEAGIPIQIQDHEEFQATMNTAAEQAAAIADIILADAEAAS